VSSEDGRALDFYNANALGTGVVGRYEDTGEEYASDKCFIDGIRCTAEEGRFGGITICLHDEQRFNDVINQLANWERSEARYVLIRRLLYLLAVAVLAAIIYTAFRGPWTLSS